MIITAPTHLREQLTGLGPKTLVETCARLRPGDLHEPTQGVKAALRRLARRCQLLAEEIVEANRDLSNLFDSVAPGLIAQHGVGPEIAGPLLITAGDNPTRLRSEASFAALCGVSPLPASSGNVLFISGARRSAEAPRTIRRSVCLSGSPDVPVGVVSVP